MNDLPNASRLFKCKIYADDTTLIANLNDFYAKHDTGLNINILNDELEKISYWLLVNKLSLNKHLKWNSHVNKIGNKISQTIGVINKL